MSARRPLTILWRVLKPAQRRRFLALQFVSVLMAMSTFMGLAAVMTFLAILADPALVTSHAVLRWLWKILEPATNRDFLLALGVGFIALLFLSAIVNLAGSFAMARFAYAAGDRVREVLFADYLRRDYLFHARAGSARLLDNVLYQADRLPTTLLSGLVLATNVLLTLLVVVSIALVNSTVAWAGGLAIGGSYLLFYQIVRRRTGRNGRVQTELGSERTAIVKQAFLGIKYLLIARAQPAFSRHLSAVTQPLSQTLAETQFIGQFPKFVLECVAGAALIACAAFISRGSAAGAWLAQLSFIGFAGFRLLPAFQQMYYAFVVVRANRHVIETLASELDDSQRVRLAPPLPHSSGRLAFNRSLELVGVSFRFSAETPLIVNDTSVRIPAGAAIGIVGPSGCGKTTLVDLIVGLLFPDRGRIEVDGETLDRRRVAAWQKSIGYVPQEVTILDATVRENIAFGVEPAAIDDARVREVARQAGAAQFIEALPGAYAARISGLGGGLSGGQRQRIGIARALYDQPSLLVLDEATNSLDAETERAVIDSVIRNRGSRTVLIVAHAAAVIGACERVYELREGALHDRGAPPSLGVTRVRRLAE